MNKLDIIGDLHGCIYELTQLLEKLGYERTEENLFVHLEGRIPVFVGDLVDRGRSSGAVYCLVRDMVKAGCALFSRGNHDDKLMRYAKGNNVSLNHGLDKTVKDLERMGVDKTDLFPFLNSIPMYLSLDDGKLIVVHGAWYKGLKEVDPFHKKCRNWCLYAPTTGKKLPNGLPDRIDWVIERTDTEPIIVYGHQVYSEPRVLNNTYGIDTGCVFGGCLTALRYPEMEFVQVKSHEVYDSSKPEIGMR